MGDPVMSVFVTRRQFDLCCDYCVLISECLDHSEHCWGWTNDNYSDNECLWKCLTADIGILKNDLWTICRSQLLAHSEIARDICTELRKTKVIE